MTHSDYAHFVRSLAREYVTHQKDLEVDAEPKKNGVLVLVKGNKEDAGKLIGTGGATIKAVKTLVDIAAQNNNEWEGRVLVLEPTQGHEFKRETFVLDPKWDKADEMAELLAETLAFVYPGLEGDVNISDSKIKDRPGTGLEVVATIKIPLTVESALNTIFHAIGNQQGHRLNVSISNHNGS